MQPLLSTPWGSRLPLAPSLTLVHNAKTTFVGGVNPFTAPNAETLEDLLQRVETLKPGELLAAVITAALKHVNENPKSTAASTAKVLGVSKLFVSRGLRKLVEDGNLECVRAYTGGTHKYVYWAKGSVPDAITRKA